jgi:hypothetical protein
MKRSIVVLVLAVVAGLPAQVQGAPLAIAGDECPAAPSLVTELEHSIDNRHRTPEFVGDRVWFGESVFLPDGTLVGPAPDVSPRGEVPEFIDDTLDTQNVTWGVVADTFPGAKVYSPNGVLLFDLPIPVHAEAIYVDDLILVADWGDAGSHLERVMLVKQDGTVTELTSAANGFGQFGTVRGQTVYVLLRDGGIGTFDFDGNAGPVLFPEAQFTGITSGNGFVYAYGGLPAGASGAELALYVLDTSDTSNILSYLDEIPERMGPTALGYAMDVIGDDESVAYARAPNGYGSLPLIYLHDTTDPQDVLAWHQGRYLIGIDTQAETADGVVTGQIQLYRLDGVAVTTSETLKYRNWPASLPAGKVLALVGIDGQSIDFRSLSGNLLATVDYAATSTPEIETIDGNDTYVWVTTTNTANTVFTAHVYDLGECAGAPDPGRFLDDDNSVFETDIEWLANQSITRGCNPNEANTKFCPNEPVTRGQMAAFLVRALDLTDTGAGDIFTDDDNSVFENDIDILATAEITRGCNPPTNDQFCPNEPVTRSQMAALLARALAQP